MKFHKGFPKGETERIIKWRSYHFRRGLASETSSYSYPEMWSLLRNSHKTDSCGVSPHATLTNFHFPAHYVNVNRIARWPTCIKTKYWNWKIINFHRRRSRFFIASTAFEQLIQSIKSCFISARSGISSAVYLALTGILKGIFLIKIANPKNLRSTYDKNNFN